MAIPLQFKGDTLGTAEMGQLRWLPDAICPGSSINGPRMPCDGLAAGGRQTRRAQTGFELKMLEISMRKLWPRFW
jgi:hypothetical protein